MKRKIKRELEVFFQIALLVVSTFASAYIVKELFGENGLVSAAEISEEQMTVLKEAFPQMNDDEIKATVSGLLDSGRLSEEDLANPDAIREAANQMAEELESAINGELSADEFSDVFNFWSIFFPDSGGISAGDLQNELDSRGGIQTCKKTTDGKFCQQYFGNECSGKCVGGACIPKTLKEMDSSDDCRLGTCFDEKHGTCAIRSGKWTCDESKGFKWYDDPFGNVADCVKGCCVAEEGVNFVTQTQCDKIANSSGRVLGPDIGKDIQFFSLNPIDETKVMDEPTCFLIARELKLGACTYLLDDGSVPSKNGCQLVTRAECEEMGSTFNENMLCSNPSLNTICEKQNHTSCVEGKDEVYWFDNCGNRENIVDMGRADFGWNDGKILPKNESCVLGDASNPIKNQATCGNCNRFLSSYCGNETIAPPVEQELDDAPDGDVVCKDMGCYTQNFLGEWERKRENGESWCAYHSSIGMPGQDTQGFDFINSFIPADNPLAGLLGGSRGTDTPGSINFRMSCIEGKIEPAPCDNYRNQICVEQQTPKKNNPDDLIAFGTFSQASCRINRWQECLAYNKESFQGERRLIGMLGKRAPMVLKLKLMATCGQDPDCFVKTVEIDEAFSFSYCLPRYKPGFDIVGENGQEAAGQLCSQGSQSCKVTFIKKISGWECADEAGTCDCVDGDDPDSAKPSQKFIQELNDFCTSLGDCGYQVNYKGTAPGAKGFNAHEKSDNPLIGLIPDMGSILGGATLHTEDANPTPGEFIVARDISSAQGSWANQLLDNSQIQNLLSQFGVGDGGGGGNLNVGDNSAATTGRNIGLITGGAGAGIIAGTMISTISITGAGAVGYYTVAGTVVYFTGPLNPAFLAFGGYALGAGVGMAITGFLIDALGIGPGLGAAVTYSLLATGTVGGALIVGTMIKLGISTCLSGHVACVVGIILIIIVIITTLILKMFGVGDIEEKEYLFECQPWVPPAQGNCENDCGKDDMSDGGKSFPCNSYACKALGQNCEFVPDTEGYTGGACISVSQTDVSAPRIVSTMDNVITEGYTYSENDNFGAENPGQQFRILKTEGEQNCLSLDDAVTFGFNLDEYGKCRIGAGTNTMYDSMTPMGAFSKNQNYNFKVEELESLGYGETMLREIRSDIQLRIVCEDYPKGNKNEGNMAHTIDLCVIPSENVLIQTLDTPSLSCERFPRICEALGEQGALPDETETPVQPPPLSLDYIVPADGSIISSGTNPMTLQLEAKTSGGVNGDGSADCYKIVDSRNLGIMELGETRIVHKSSIEVQGGPHQITISCTDGTSVSKTANINIILDLVSPEITRVFDDSGVLVVITNENSDCSYSNERCVSFADGVVMSGPGVVHSTSFENGKDYYIKCKDEFEHENSGCLVVRRGMG